MPEIKACQAPRAYNAAEQRVHGGLTLRTTDALVKLDAHQAAIAEQIAHARRFIRQPIEEARSQLSRGRWEMARRLRAYQLFKQVEIFDPLCASSDPARSGNAQRLKAACIEAGDLYASYTRCWSAGGATADWERYLAAFEKMAAAIEHNLAVERRGIGLLLSGITRTRHN